MAEPKLGVSKKHEPMHYSVGALIKKNNKYLMIDRAKFPPGFAGVAGHVDDGENEHEALEREVQEESGLKLDSSSLLFEEELDWNECRRGVKTHNWFLFECAVSGTIKRNYGETKSIGWYNVDELKQLKLEPVWDYWFKKLKII
jgi:8-oxo-dGTP pyrophosphatase MutT (NUDIX family)